VRQYRPRDDLVQKPLLRALAHIDSFRTGHQHAGMAVHDLRNLFRSEYRKRRREVEDADGRYAETLKSPPGANRPRRNA